MTTGHRSRNGEWRVASGERRTQRGGALLAVLWLAAGLSAIAFSVATTVRGETERASTAAERTRAHYLAAGSIERAILWISWGLQSPGAVNPDGSPRYYQPPMPYLRFNYPAGPALVEVIPEAGKLNVNTAIPRELQALLVALGTPPEQAGETALRIVQWREAGEQSQILPLAAGPPSSFQPRHASFQELEDILLVPGVTPDLFYGHYDHDDSGRLIPRGGLRDSLTVYGRGEQIDVNTAAPALLLSLGIPQAGVDEIVKRRMLKPIKSLEEIAPFTAGAQGAGRLGVGGLTIWTLRATARLTLGNGKLSELRSSAAAIVKFFPPEGDAQLPYHILRWYDDAWSPATAVGF